MYAVQQRGNWDPPVCSHVAEARNRRVHSRRRPPRSQGQVTVAGIPDTQASLSKTGGEVSHTHTLKRTSKKTNRAAAFFVCASPSPAAPPRGKTTYSTPTSSRCFAGGAMRRCVRGAAEARERPPMSGAGVYFEEMPPRTKPCFSLRACRAARLVYTTSSERAGSRGMAMDGVPTGGKESVSPCTRAAHASHP